MTTKEQERKALEQIRKIVEGLGEGSYIATAMEGMFEDAEENIENDWGCSWKDRAERASLDTAEMSKKYAELFEKKVEVERKTSELERDLSETKEDLDFITNQKDKYKEAMERECEAKVEAERKVEALEWEVTRLKAKLYDLLVK